MSPPVVDGNKTKRCGPLHRRVWCEDVSERVDGGGGGGGGATCNAGECWLKWQANPKAPAVMSHGAGTPWRAGSLAKSFVRAMNPVSPYAGEGDPGVVTLSWAAPQGTGTLTIRIRLRPDWSPNSAAWARRVAGSGACGPWCTFYRAEPVPKNWAVEGFYGPPYALLQGGLRSGPPTGSIPDNVADAPDERNYPVMRRGMVAWAGGGLGPDFFIALGDHPEWGNGHVVWGEIVDDVDEEEDLGASWRAIEDVMSKPTKLSKGVGPTGVDTLPLVNPLKFAAGLEVTSKSISE